MIFLLFGFKAKKPAMNMLSSKELWAKAKVQNAGLIFYGI